MEKLANKFLNDNELVNRLFESNPRINNKIFVPFILFKLCGAFLAIFNSPHRQLLL